MQSTVSYFTLGLALAQFSERLLLELKHSRMYAHLARACYLSSTLAGKLNGQQHLPVSSLLASQPSPASEGERGREDNHRQLFASPASCPYFHKDNLHRRDRTPCSSLYHGQEISRKLVAPVRCIYIFSRYAMLKRFTVLNMISTDLIGFQLIPSNKQQKRYRPSIYILCEVYIVMFETV